MWTINKKLIDPIVPRYVALEAAGLVTVHVTDGPATVVCQARRGLTAAVAMGNPYCGCELTRVRSAPPAQAEAPEEPRGGDEDDALPQQSPGGEG